MVERETQLFSPSNSFGGADALFQSACFAGTIARLEEGISPAEP